MSEGRRVRNLRLRAATPALVQRGALLLEDALRTASMPDPGRGRVLFIRSLALGTIRADRSSSSLALALEQRVRALASAAVHAEEEGAAAAHAVYFADAVQALVAVAARIGRRGAMAAWFWPLVVPEAWGKPADEGLRAVLKAALEAEPGPAAAVALVEGLVEREAVAPLLGALRWSEGPALARAFWGHAPEVPRGVVLARAPAPELEQVPPRARKVLETWVEAWGPEDLRSVWLAAVVMSLPRPARVVEAELPARAIRVVAAVAPGARARRPREEVPVEGREREVSVPAPAPEVEVPRRPGAVEPVVAPAPAPRPAEEALERVEQAPEVPEAPAMRPPREAEAEAEAEPARDQETLAPAEAAPPVESWPEAPRPTRAGGLPFLVHALDYLGLPAMLEAQPALRERAVAEHFLVWVATRLGVPPADPMVRALRPEELPPLGAPCAFEVSERFRKRSGARIPSREIALDDPPRTPRSAAAASSPPAGRVLEMDARGRMALAVRYPLTSEEQDSGSGAGAPEPAARQARQDNLLRTPDLELLLRALHVATSRLLRTRAKISLRALVLRPGRVAATRSHLDVLFDHAQAEVGIRAAGLDIDPGWVPWLGRVIRYHYLPGELPPA